MNRSISFAWFEHIEAHMEVHRQIPSRHLESISIFLQAKNNLSTVESKIQCLLSSIVSLSVRNSLNDFLLNFTLNYRTKWQSGRSTSPVLYYNALFISAVEDYPTRRAIITDGIQLEIIGYKPTPTRKRGKLNEGASFRGSFSSISA